MVPLHAVGGPLDPALVAVVAVGGLAAAALLGLALAAFARRRSRPYLLVALALATLLARAVVATLTMVEVLPPTRHHLYEHGLDVAMSALVIAAVYNARRTTHAGEATDR